MRDRSARAWHLRKAGVGQASIITHWGGGFGLMQSEPVDYLLRFIADLFLFEDGTARSPGSGKDSASQADEAIIEGRIVGLKRCLERLMQAIARSAERGAIVRSTVD